MPKPPALGKKPPPLPSDAILRGIAADPKGDHVGVFGSSVSAPAIWAEGKDEVGLYATSVNQPGVLGTSDRSVGVLGQTDHAAFEAVRGVTSTVYAAVGAYSNHRPSKPEDNPGVALWAEKTGPGFAGMFIGDVKVEGQLRVEGQLQVKVDIILDGGDCAEEFNVDSSGMVEPGTVMILGSEGALSPSERAYDRRVAGIISGAGAYRPGLILGRGETGLNRVAIALVGKVYCKVDASYSAIEIGDLLTTSDTLAACRT